jgi:hypothetical protein
MLSPYWAWIAAVIVRMGMEALNIASTCRHNPGCRSSIASSLQNLSNAMDFAPPLKLGHWIIWPSGHLNSLNHPIAKSQMTQ